MLHPTSAVDSNWFGSTQIALVKRTVLDLYKKYEISASLSPRRVSDTYKTVGLKLRKLASRLRFTLYEIAHLIFT